MVSSPKGAKTITPAQAPVCLVYRRHTGESTCAIKYIGMLTNFYSYYVLKPSVATNFITLMGGL